MRHQKVHKKYIKFEKTNKKGLLTFKKTNKKLNRNFSEIF